MYHKSVPFKKCHFWQWLLTHSRPTWTQNIANIPDFPIFTFHPFFSLFFLHRKLSVPPTYTALYENRRSSLLCPWDTEKKREKWRKRAILWKWDKISTGWGNYDEFDHFWRENSHPDTLFRDKNSSKIFTKFYGWFWTWRSGGPVRDQCVKSVENSQLGLIRSWSRLNMIRM